MNDAMAYEILLCDTHSLCGSKRNLRWETTSGQVTPVTDRLRLRVAA